MSQDEREFEKSIECRLCGMFADTRSANIASYIPAQQLSRQLLNYP